MSDLTLAQMQSEAEVKTRLSSAKRQHYEAMVADTNDMDILRAAIATLCDDNERLALQTQALVAATLEAAAGKARLQADGWKVAGETAKANKNPKEARDWQSMMLAGLFVEDSIRALITAPQRDALKAVIDAAKAEARAEDAKEIADLKRSHDVVSETLRKLGGATE